MKYDQEKAWLRLVHTPGIGPKNAWKIFHQAKESGLTIADVFHSERIGTAGLDGLSNSLNERLNKSNFTVAEERFSYLQRSSIRLLHPGSSVYNVPRILGLPPTLTLWGDLGLLNRQDVVVLMKSRDTSLPVLKAFLQNVAQGRTSGKYWCYCPFSKVDWELIESLLKLECGMILGLVSGISRRAITLAHETPAGRMAILAPEPPLNSRGRLFACVEAFYRLFSTFTKKIFLIHMSERGKTVKRVNWAREIGCQITEFVEGENESGGDALPSNSEKIKGQRDSKSPDPSVNEDDEGFISCL